MNNGVFPAWKNSQSNKEQRHVKKELQYGRLVHKVAWWNGGKKVLTERLHFRFSLSCIGGGNGNPLQCSCLENPRDGGAWWAAVYGVAQSWTQLKWLSSSSRADRCGFRSQQLPGVWPQALYKSSWCPTLLISEDYYAYFIGFHVN